MSKLPAWLVAALAVGACDSHLEAKVGGATLAQAYGVLPAPAGPVVVLRRDQPAPTLPAGPVRLAIDLAVPWEQVRPVLDGAAAAGSAPALLVGQRHRVRGFVLDDPPADEPALRVTANARGRFCLSPPDNDEAYCVESGDHRHISSMYVREAVGKALKTYGLRRVQVRPTGDLSWGDLVRVVDGSRTSSMVGVAVTVVR